MKTPRKCLGILFLALALIFTAVPGFSAAKKKIVVVQFQTFQPDTVSLEGFMEGLEDLNYRDDVIIEKFNAERSIERLEAGIEKLSKRTDVDLFFTLGTHSTVRMIKAEKETPIVFTSLADPENAGIVDDWKSSGANYTGVETPKYITMVIKLMHSLVPFKRLGMVYIQGAPSHEGAIRQVKKLSEELGFVFVAKGFKNRDENRKLLPKETILNNLREALDSVLSQTDVFFVNTSKTYLTNFSIFRNKFVKYGTMSSGDPIYIRKGIIMGIGRNVKEFGRQTAEYAVKILKDGVDPATLPMDIGVTFTIEINLKAAEMVNYHPAVDLLGAADEIYQEIED